MNTTEAVPAAFVVAANGGPAQLNGVVAGPETECVIVVGNVPASLDVAVHGTLVAVPHTPAKASEELSNADSNTS